MDFTQDARALLSPKHIRLLLEAATNVVDILLADVVNMSGDAAEDPDRLDAAPWLPSQFAQRYDRSFLVRMMTCAVVVGHKMVAPRESALACVGEKIAFYMIVGEARAAAHSKADWAEDDWKALDDYEEQVLEDAEFTSLYDEGQPGESASPQQVRRTGSDHRANLRFENWFAPFREDEPVHPLCRRTSEL